MAVAAILSGMRPASVGNSSRAAPGSRRIWRNREPSIASGPHSVIDWAARITLAQPFIAQTAQAVRAAAVGGDPCEQPTRQPLQRSDLGRVQQADQLLDRRLPPGEYPPRRLLA